MYLKSLTIKGFKSFPERSKLLFSPGVSVIVGPNGSGKSNITDAVLWALGEQSPLAVRGQQMQDVIFAGGKGLSPRRFAEVEVIIDNSEGRANTEFSEISIKRRLDRGGDGEYRLNGARCRLVDILEVLSDTNLGREMHSVISQGRVEEIVNSKPRDRRMLIEEAAGLGKHRKRRRRAELKLEKTRDNLDRVLDVEREARARLRPLKQQAQAAEVQARLNREQLELRAELVADRLREQEAQLARSETGAGTAREKREEIEERLSEVAKRREAAEARLASRDRERAILGQRLIALRSTRDRLGLRLELMNRSRAELEAGLGERRGRLAAFAQEELDTGDGGRVVELEAELAKLSGGEEAGQGDREAGLAAATQRRDELAAGIPPLREALTEAEQALASARTAHGQAAEAAEKAKRLHASLRGELEAVEAKLAAAGEEQGAPALASSMQAAPGLELALSAALGERLRAALVDSREEGAKRLDDAEGAARALLRRFRGKPAATEPPVEDARPLLDMVEADEGAEEIAGRLLADTWLVEDLGALPDDFQGIAVTLEGRCFDGSSGELRQVPRQATDPALAARSEREELVLRVQQRQQSEERAAQELEKATEALDEALAAQEKAAGAQREAQRQADEATEEANRLEWLSKRGTAEAGEAGPDAVRRASLEAELAAERRHAEAAEKAQQRRESDRDALAARIEAEEALLPELETLRESLEGLGQALDDRLKALDERSAADDESGEEVAEELRACSRNEAEIQAELRPAVEAVTQAEVEAAQLRDRHAAVVEELAQIAKGLERKLEAASEELSEERREEIDRKLVRLERRREKLGPVNPLAEREYEQERERVGELETERQDVERALAELEKLIGDTDRQIHNAFEETFDATAKNFEELVEHLFPGGRGQLRRLNLREVPDAEQPDEEDELDAEEEFGVEIEVTPAGKAMKRLSLLSGGEKSLVALAFVFAVFLARPCPFYILDEVEAALDDANIDRFLQLVRRFSDRAQFVIVTHQKRTMDAADVLYGASMGQDGVTKMVSKRLPRDSGGESGGDDSESISVVEAA